MASHGHSDYSPAQHPGYVGHPLSILPPGHRFGHDLIAQFFQECLPDIADSAIPPELIGEDDPMIALGDWLATVAPSATAYKTWDVLPVEKGAKEYIFKVANDLKTARKESTLRRLLLKRDPPPFFASLGRDEEILPVSLLRNTPDVSSSRPPDVPMAFAELTKEGGRFHVATPIPVVPLVEKQLDIDEVLDMKLIMTTEDARDTVEYRARVINLMREKVRASLNVKPGEEPIWERWREETMAFLDACPRPLSPPILTAKQMKGSTLWTDDFGDMQGVILTDQIDIARAELKDMQGTGDTAITGRGLVTALKQLNKGLLEHEGQSFDDPYSLATMDTFDEPLYELLTPSSKGLSRSVPTSAAQYDLRDLLTPSRKHRQRMSFETDQEEGPLIQAWSYADDRMLGEPDNQQRQTLVRYDPGKFSHSRNPSRDNRGGYSLTQTYEPRHPTFSPPRFEADGYPMLIGKTHLNEPFSGGSSNRTYQHGTIALPVNHILNPEYGAAYNGRQWQPQGYMKQNSYEYPGTSDRYLAPQPEFDWTPPENRSTYSLVRPVPQQPSARPHEKIPDAYDQALFDDNLDYDQQSVLGILHHPSQFTPPEATDIRRREIRPDSRSSLSIHPFRMSSFSRQHRLEVDQAGYSPSVLGGGSQGGYKQTHRVVSAADQLEPGRKGSFAYPDNHLHFQSYAQPSSHPLGTITNVSVNFGKRSHTLDFLSTEDDRLPKRPKNLVDYATSAGFADLVKAKAATNQVVQAEKTEPTVLLASAAQLADPKSDRAKQVVVRPDDATKQMIGLNPNKTTMGTSGQVSDKWKASTVLRNDSWYLNTVKAPLPKNVEKITILVNIEVLQDRNIVASLTSLFELLEHAGPIQGADLVLSTRTAVLFRKLRNLDRNVANVEEALKIASKYFNRIIIVFEAAQYSLQLGGEAHDDDPLTSDVRKALGAVRRTASEVRKVATKNEALISETIDLTFALNGIDEVSRVLRMELEAELETLKANLEIEEALELCEERDWLREVKPPKKITETYMLNSFAAAYISHVAKSFQVFAFGLNDEQRLRGYSEVLGEKTIVRFNKIVARKRKREDESPKEQKRSRQTLRQGSEPSPDPLATIPHDESAEWGFAKSNQALVVRESSR